MEQTESGSRDVIILEISRYFGDPYRNDFFHASNDVDDALRFLQRLVES